jgi:serine/threonine-protein kinase
MSVSVGDKLGPYEILASIGAGGMGEVFRGRDTRLDRDVAIKVLPAALASDPERLARFEREAKTLASLNHPNIAQIYGLEEAGRTRALVMELVLGQPLPIGVGVPMTINYAQQIAGALEAAHANGIVHRDLKPANVLVTAAGVIKVLDFGLATVIKPSAGNATEVQTVTGSLTQAGAVMGTPAYMSPEQARGKPVDQRSDIWSFGVLLFEMLAGRSPFAGETTSDTIAAILMRDADLKALPAGVPDALRSLLARCLERDVERRLADIGEAQRLLEHSAGGSQSSGRRMLLWVAAAVTVAILAIAGFLWQHRSPSTAAPAATLAQAQSIAVLPFVNQSGNAEDEYFSDGMTDELASALIKVPRLRVAARSSSFTFKGKAVDAREVGQKLHVTSVLEGTVRRAGTKLRVTAELVSANDGLVQWSDRYERDSKDVFRVQDDITAAIIGALRLKLSPEASATVPPRRPENPEAHDLYLRGRFFLMKQDESGLHKSLDYFQRALAKDPAYVSAYNGISFAWLWLADFYVPPNEAYPKAKTAALKALELDSTDGDAQTMLANVEFYYEWKWDAGLERFRRAVELNPESADTNLFYGLTLCARKHTDQGLAMLDRAISLDPLAPISSWGREWCLCTARRFDDVIEQHKRTAELDPDFFYIAAPLAMAYGDKGMLAQSLAEYEHARRVTGRPVFGMALTLVRMGRVDEARKLLTEFLDEARSRYVAPEIIASVYAALGEKDQAFVWLERAYQAHSSGPLANNALNLPDFDSIRTDPRFAVLQQKIGLVQ